MLSATDPEANTILGLDSGTNDYVLKPFRTPVLRAHLRQQEASGNAVCTVNRFVFKPRGEISVDEATTKKVHLTEKETGIHRYL
jgi:DNA-binding response OmpR family regulator